MSPGSHLLRLAVSAGYEARWVLTSLPLGLLFSWGFFGSLEPPGLLLGLLLGWAVLRLAVRLAFRLTYALLRLGHRPPPD